MWLGQRFPSRSSRLLRRYLDWLQLQRQFTTLSRRQQDPQALGVVSALAQLPMLALPKLPGKVWFGSMSQGVVEHRKQVPVCTTAAAPPPLSRPHTFAQALQDYLLELTDRGDVCACGDTLRFLNADEHNTAVKHAIQEDLRQAMATNLHTEETRAKVEEREVENSSLQLEIDCLLREAAAVHARCESCDTEINALRPMIVEQVCHACGRRGRVHAALPSCADTTPFLFFMLSCRQKYIFRVIKV